MDTFADNRFREAPHGVQDDPARYVRRVLAVDPQPEVLSPFRLDPSMWMGDGRRRERGGLADVEHDNTMHAGLAVVALLAFEECFSFARQPVAVAAEAAVDAYRAAARLDGEEFSAVLTELFAGAMHLMDARGIDLQAQPVDEMGLTLGTMLFALENLSATQWVERLAGERFEDLLAAAHAHYWDQLTAVDPGEPEQVERTRSVAAVWIACDGTFSRIAWCLDPRLHQDDNGRCLGCLFIGAAAELAGKADEPDDTCPGLEAHRMVAFQEVVEQTDQGAVASSQFEVPARLSRIGAVLAEIERQILAL